MNIIHNKHGRRKPMYRVTAQHKTKKNGQGKPEIVKISLNNGFHTMDGKLEAGWDVRSLNLGSETFKDWEDAKERFKELTGETPPEPEFETNLQGVEP